MFVLKYSCRLMVYLIFTRNCRVRERCITNKSAYNTNWFNTHSNDLYEYFREYVKQLMNRQLPLPSCLQWMCELFRKQLNLFLYNKMYVISVFGNCSSNHMQCKWKQYYSRQCPNYLLSFPFDLVYFCFPKQKIFALLKNNSMFV